MSPGSDMMGQASGGRMPALFKGKYSALVLKLVAVTSMLIDHIGAAVYEQYLYRHDIYSTGFFDSFASAPNAWSIYYILRIIGRLAFPIYCFLIVEGFYYTHDRRKYAFRLLIFGLISEIPFDLAFRQTPFTFSYNNVFFTLLLGLLAIWSHSEGRKRAASDTFERVLLNYIGPVTCMLAGEFLNTDYGVAGVLCIFVMYRLYHNRVLAMAVGVLILTCLSSPMELAAFVDVPLILFYNGTRGRQIKYFFYGFYPVHLLILACIGMLI